MASPGHGPAGLRHGVVDPVHATAGWNPQKCPVTSEPAAELVFLLDVLST
jgi:hypothetical protein